MPADTIAPLSPQAHRSIRFTRIAADGQAVEIEREIAAEVPIALEYQGIGYAVLMATPADLEDLAVGFSLSERLVDVADQVLDVDVHPAGAGFVVRVSLRHDVAERILDRVRHRATDSSCGLCGIENLEQALRPLPQVGTVSAAEDSACFRALAALGDHQLLNRTTGAVHAAAACSANGEILLVREDVGRHNAFDKLIGAMLRAEQDWDGGFALVSSRCSYEMVEKAVLARCPMLAAISAPTALAVDRASAAGLRLRALVRADALLAFDP
ncbi:formate dehydrogenase accessory sulfurtransferase FdhD [Sphingomonas sp. AP4-R1]|uniref:formate dehydrogenase accessory sulfurtransferase FdhD n=1 Tax=Sphingomonas sp. AP4-R1 TaxID=2735134 RepID=UPI00149375F8|nr:formate dehydrogenase accessory sulfurtransferase FdhD [Sphingomonas sp. AP4-R1]QJU58559.1 formate dehydrogenase accessory sulfurtransferase FdhD [Sphingomonas sp. AP4-R1]